MKPSELSALLAKAISARRPVLIVGMPGVGKSDIVAQAAQTAGAALQVNHPVVSDPTDFKGMPAVVDGKAQFLPFGDLRALTEATGDTVCFLDDLGQAPACVQAAAMQLLLARRVNGHKVSDSVTFVAASNRRQDKAGVTAILEPVKSRFAAIVHLEPDLEDWCAWALTHGMPADVVAFVRFRPAFLSDFKPTADMVNSACPRTIANAGQWIADGVDSFDVIAGAAGESFATEYLAFRQIWTRLPSPDAILLDPDNAPVPAVDDCGTMYALCGALTAKATDQTAGRIIRYANRLPAEFGVFLVRDVTRTCPAAHSTAEFIQWASAHQDVLL